MGDGQAAGVVGTTWVDAFESTRDFGRLHALVTSTARALAGADGATFVVREAEQCFYVAEDAMSPLWAGQRFPLTECISGWAMIHDEPAVVPDIQADPRVPMAAYRPTFVQSLLMVPVPGGAGEAKPMAAIGTYWASHHRPSSDEVETLLRLAEVTASALERLGVENAPWAPRLRS
ncbi:MAG TPA: GAF domain-containing protein [Marmoricola sp.]|nr:GAF domain-containing protein [Marmoricola sp.]